MHGIHTYFSSPWSTCVFNRAGHLIFSTRDKLICFDANGRELRSQTEPLGPMLVVDGLLTIPRRGMVVAVPSEFSPFGPDHLVALLLTGLATALLVAWARGRRGEPVTEIPARVLALSMIAAQLADPYCRHLLGTLDWQHALPVEICDLASFACVFALLTRRPLAFELAYFWGLAGTLQALLTPAVARGFPHLEFLRFFLLHGAIVAGVFYLGPGLGMAPRRGAVRRVYGFTVVHAVFVGLLDWAIGANYMFLRTKPAGSVLDLLGPWPFYLPAGAALAALLFWILDLPYRRGRAGTTGAA